MEQETNNDQGAVIKLLRWAAFVPAGIISGAISGAIVLALFFITSWLVGAPIKAPINYILAAGLSGYITVYVGVYVAPSSNEKIAGCILATLMILTGIVSIYIRASNEEWFRALDGTCVIVGTLMALSQTKSNELL